MTSTAKSLCFLLIWCCNAQPKVASDQLLAIQDAITAGDLGRAESLLVPSLAARPNDAGLLNLRGVIHAQRGELVDARTDFLRAVELDPQLTPAWKNLARACGADAQQKRASAECAERAWDRVLKAAPQDEEAHVGLALALECEGRYADSLQTLRIGDSKSLAGRMVRCLDLSGLNRTGDALAVARTLAGEAEFGEADLEAMSRAAPAAIVILAEGLDARSALQVPGLKQLAIAYEHTDRLADARKTLERVAAAEPKNLANLLELARVSDKQNDHEGALGYLGHARELAPNDAQVHFLFGMEAAQMNLPMEARKSFERALELSPANPDYEYALGSVILYTRDASTAVAYFEKYVAARPAEAKGHYALGVAEFTSGDYDKAKLELKSVERDSLMGGGAEFYLGRMARLEGDLDAAARYETTAMQRMPTFSESHTEMARVCMEEGDLAKAGAELRRALLLDPNSFQANEQLLSWYKRTHDPRAAEQTELLKKLDEERSKRAELMLRGIEIKP